MDPFFASNRLSDYLDGHLSEEESADIAAAIASDASLRAEYESLKRAVTMLRTHGPSTAPDGFHDTLMEHIGAERRPGVLVQLRAAFRQVPLEALALAAAAVIVVVVLLDPSAPSDGAPTIVDARGGAVAPISDIEPAADLSLPTASASAAPAAPVAAPPPRQQVAPSIAQKPKMTPPTEAYVPDWEKPALPVASTPDTPPIPTDDLGGSADSFDSMDDINVTPDELTGGVQAEVSTPYEYRISLSDAEVLFSLQQLAQSAGGRLLDHLGEPLSARSLTAEQNYARVQLVVPPGRAEQIHTRLKELGGRAVMPANGTPLYGAQYVAFVIEVSYIP
jgi:anti-sigma factor RsiW